MSRYAVVENTPGYLPESEPFVGTWDECASVMDAMVHELVDEGWSVLLNDGCGFRLASGTRRTYLLPPDAHEHSLSRVVEVVEAPE